MQKHYKLACNPEDFDPQAFRRAAEIIAKELGVTIEVFDGDPEDPEVDAAMSDVGDEPQIYDMIVEHL